MPPLDGRSAHLDAGVDAVLVAASGAADAPPQHLPKALEHGGLIYRGSAMERAIGAVRAGLRT